MGVGMGMGMGIGKCIYVRLSYVLGNTSRWFLVIQSFERVHGGCG